MARQTYSWPAPSAVKNQGYPATKAQTQDEPWVGTKDTPSQTFPSGKNPNSQGYSWPDTTSTAKQSYPASNRHSDMEDTGSALALAQAASRGQYRQGYPAKDTPGAHAGGGNFSYAMNLATRQPGSQGSTFPDSIAKQATEVALNPALSLARAIASTQNGKGFGPK